MLAPRMLIFSSVLTGSGMNPIRFEYQMNRKMAPMNGNHFAAIRSSMFPRVMLSRIRPKSVSTAVCTRLGRSCIRRAT